MSKYKYFTEEEVAGLDPELALKLDQMRSLAGIPITITCGYRSPEHNLEIGGVDHSAHTKGLAADLACPDSDTRFKLLKAAYSDLLGFKRIGDETQHIHVDIDSSLPQNVAWVGISH